ncbi:MAG: HAD family hydrolase [Candidatus Egerieousia sp.]
MIKNIILDFDGTLADTRSLIVRTMQSVISSMELPARSDDECAAMIGLPLKETFTKLIPMCDEMGEKCVEKYAEIFLRDNVPGAVPAFEGVPETLMELYDRGYTLTIASSRNRPSLEGFLKDLDLAKYISMIVCVADVIKSKPAPDMVLKILKATGCAPEESLVVGDTKYDIEMGRSAGAYTCGVTYGNGSREELSSAGAVYIVNKFPDILNISLIASK